MKTLTQTRAADDDEITHAMYDAICDGEGHSSAYYLKHHLAKHGLVIVEAARHDKMLTALQLIGSYDGPDVALLGRATIARNAIIEG
jgi:hypothetical protein